VKTLKMLSIAVPLATLIAWGLLALAQLWVEVVSEDAFVKITISAAIVIVVSVITAISVRGYVENSELKKQGYLDD
jgi:membrane protein implicated in regulation of membrane protease activity